MRLPHAVDVLRRAPAPLRCIPALVLLATLAAGSGCYDEEDPPRQPAPTAESTTTESTNGGSSSATSGGGSHLGAAKRSAKSTVNALEERSRDVEKQIEDDD